MEIGEALSLKRTKTFSPRAVSKAIQMKSEMSNQIRFEKTFSLDDWRGCHISQTKTHVWGAHAGGAACVQMRELGFMDQNLVQCTLSGLMQRVLDIAK